MGGSCCCKVALLGIRANTLSSSHQLWGRAGAFVLQHMCGSTYTRLLRHTTCAAYYSTALDVGGSSPCISCFCPL